MFVVCSIFLLLSCGCQQILFKVSYMIFEKIEWTNKGATSKTELRLIRSIKAQWQQTTCLFLHRSIVILKPLRPSSNLKYKLHKNRSSRDNFETDHELRSWPSMSNRTNRIRASHENGILTFLRHGHLAISRFSGIASSHRSSSQFWAGFENQIVHRRRDAGGWTAVERRSGKEGTRRDLKSVDLGINVLMR